MNALKFKTLASPVRITATNTGASFDLSGLDGKAMLNLSSSGCEGSDNTLNVKIQHSPDNSAWTDAVMPITGVPMAFPQVINAASLDHSLDISIPDLHRYIRAVQTLAGTTPASTSAVTLLARQKRV